MVDKLIDGAILKKLHQGYDLTPEEEAAYNEWLKPPDDDYDDVALQEAKAAVENEVFGMYGTLAKKYCLEDNPEKGARLGKELAEYLHTIDEAAEHMARVLEDKYSKDERFAGTGNYLEDVRRKQRVNELIFEEITSSLMYAE